MRNAIGQHVNREGSLLCFSSIGRLASLSLVLSFLWGCSGSADSSRQAISRGSVSAEGESTTSPEQNKARLVSREMIPQDWLPAINEEDRFFHPPASEVAVTAVAEIKTENETLRLLGFAESEVEGEMVPRAIVKIGPAMHYMRVGDRQHGVELISIADGSVTLQQGRDRVLLQLMGQPIVNQSTSFERAPDRRATSSSRRTDYSSTTSARDSHFPIPPLSTSDTGDLPQLPDLPEPPDLEGLPELPTIDDLPELGNLPGLSGSSF